MPPAPKPVLALAVLALSLAPAALAWVPDTGWDDEPSTAHDTPDKMFQSPNAGPAQRAYFAGTLNAQRRFEAMLGYWLDCNGDGFVGDLLTGARDYYVLSFPANCPPPYVSVVGGLIRVDELREIGPGAQTLNGEVPDKDARVWVDWGEPGAPFLGTGVKTRVDEELTYHGPSGVWVGAFVWPAAWNNDPTPGWVQFFASVSDAATTSVGGALPAGQNAHVYGEEICGSMTTGIFSDWDCDPSHWPFTPRVGAFYDLRDTDYCDWPGC